jgi:superfamily II DNA or RNA helicase
MGYLVVPREYIPPYTAWIEEPTSHVVEAIGKLSAPFPVSNIELREKQIRPFEVYLKEQKGIIQLSCGGGKTVLSLALAQKLGLPTLIIVNTRVLLDQWKREILKFFPTLDQKHIGHVQQKVFKYKDLPFTVAMLHTLSSRIYELDFYKYFGLIIFDEVHNLSTEHFKVICNQFYGKRLGLSASPKRHDNMDIVYRLHIGNVIYTDLRHEIKSEIYFIKTGIAESDITPRQMYKWGSRDLNWGGMYTAISQLERFNELILQNAVKATDKGRKVLILGERVEQLYLLCERLALLKPNVSCGLVIGPMKNEQRQLSLERDAVFATSRLAEEGLDCPAFDTLFILFPKATKKSVQQAIGRILRKHDGKETPITLIFVHDGIPALNSIAAKVKRNLEELGYDYHND